MLVQNHPLSTNLFTGRRWGVTSGAKDIFISKKFCGCEKLSYPGTMLNDQKKIGIIGSIQFAGLGRPKICRFRGRNILAYKCNVTDKKNQDIAFNNTDVVRFDSLLIHISHGFFTAHVFN